jgi:hypothetical protein
MITYTEMFLFVCLLVAVMYIIHCKEQIKRTSMLFNLLVQNEKVRNDILSHYEQWKKQHEA